MKTSTVVVEELVSPFSAAGVGRQGTTHRDVDDASDLLKRLFRSFNGSFALRLWNGTTLRLGKTGPDQPDPQFTLVFRNPSV